MRKLVIAVDDEGEATLLQQMIEHSSFSSLFDISYCTTLSELELILAQGRIDVLVINTMFREHTKTGTHLEDGVLAVSRLIPPNENTQVIYLVGSERYRERVYETRHVYALEKPATEERLSRALEKAVFEMRTSSPPPLEVMAKGTVYSLPPRKIRYIESDRHKVRITAGDKTIEAYASLEDIARHLPDSFIRCHKGFLVNMDYIEEVSKTDIMLMTGESVPLSQRKRVEVREGYQEYLQNRRTM